MLFDEIKKFVNDTKKEFKMDEKKLKNLTEELKNKITVSTDKDELQKSLNYISACIVKTHHESAVAHGCLAGCFLGIGSAYVAKLSFFGGALTTLGTTYLGGSIARTLLETKLAPGETSADKFKMPYDKALRKWAYDETLYKWALIEKTLNERIISLGSQSTTTKTSTSGVGLRYRKA